MHKTLVTLGMLLALASFDAHAQLAPTPAPDQISMLKSGDPKLQRNKHLRRDPEVRA